MTVPTDVELIALLHSPRPQDKAAAEQYLDSLPPATVNKTLHRIASQVVKHRNRPRLVHIPLTQTKAQENNEALLLLAARNDSRALPLLLSEWQMRPPEKRRGWNARVEAEATRLLDENQSGTTSVEGRTMRKIIEQLVPLSLSRGRKDITPGQAYFAAAMLRVLSHAGGEGNRALLKKVAALPTDVKNFPHRTLVTEVAAVYQEEAVAPTAPPTAPMSAMTPTDTPCKHCTGPDSLSGRKVLY